ncbi:hypothetical protein BGZ52_000181, partial [Haplosporangium bisporale]
DLKKSVSKRRLRTSDMPKKCPRRLAMRPASAATSPWSVCVRSRRTLRRLVRSRNELVWPSSRAILPRWRLFKKKS